MRPGQLPFSSHLNASTTLGVTLATALALMSGACDRTKRASDPLAEAYHKLAPITIDARATKALEERELLLSLETLDGATLPEGPLLLFGPPTKQGPEWPLRHVAPDTSPEAVYTIAADQGAFAAPLVRASGELLLDAQSRSATQHLLVRRAQDGKMAGIVLSDTPHLSGCESFAPAEVSHDAPGCEACLGSGRGALTATSCQVATLHVRPSSQGEALDYVVTLRPAMQDTDRTGCIDLPARATPFELDAIDRAWGAQGESAPCARDASASELLKRVAQRETLCDHVQLNATGDVPAQAIVDTIAQLAAHNSELLYSISLDPITAPSLEARCKP